MYIDRNILDEYPFDGVFYINKDVESPDGDLIGGGDTVEEEIILETKCDVQETQKAFTAGAITASFNVYFPFDKGTGINVERGMMFRANVYGMDINGMVIGVFPTQMGGCLAYIKSPDV